MWGMWEEWRTGWSRSRTGFEATLSGLQSIPAAVVPAGTMW